MRLEGDDTHPDPDFAPGGFVCGPKDPDDDTSQAWLSPGEPYFTAEDVRQMRESSGEEWDEGKVS